MKLDHNKIYYKVTNERERHNGLQYKTGLIKDILPFNSDTNKTCTKGRIYFTDLEHLPLFFRNDSSWIRPLSVPEDAQAVAEDDKIGTDKIIMKNRITFKEYFTTLFDPDKFDWRYSYCLTQYCSEYFTTWFDPDKYNWRYSYRLAQYCSKYFKLWFDPEKYNWEYSYYLARYCSKYFKLWFDPEKYNWEYSYYLAQYCSEYFKLWFDPEKYNWEYSDYLAEHCSEYKHIFSKYIKK